MVKRAVREQALELRRQGMSMRDIASTLHVSKGSVSLWVRDIVLTQEQQAVLHYRHAITKGA